MLVLVHVIIALSSIGYAGYTYIVPTKNRLRLSQIFIGLTVASGTYLVISTKASLVSACITGLIYLSIVATALVLAHRRLAADTATDKVD